MSKLSGTNVSAPIMPFTTDDSFATHLAKYGKGGFRSVETIAEMNAITPDRREEGMLVYVVNDPNGINLYQLKNNLWTRAEVSSIKRVDTDAEMESLPASGGDIVYSKESKVLYYYKDATSGQVAGWVSLNIEGDLLGLPIFDNNMIAELIRKGKLPADYINIPSESEFEEPAETPQGTGTYLNIVFNAIRALQTEIGKMRNAFNYGIVSYTGEHTAMSNVMYGYQSSSEEEPLWATEESDLSAIVETDMEIGDKHTLVPKANVISSTGVLEINSDGAKWVDNGEALLNSTDPKNYLFLTTSGLNVKINIRHLSEVSQTAVIDLSNLGIPISASQKYNILVVLSKAIKVNGTFYGKNFAWLSVANWADGGTLTEGYWVPGATSLSPTYIPLGDETQLGSGRYAITSVDYKSLNLYKQNFYSKYQDFTNTVNPSRPDDTDYKYKVAHLTIRSVEDETILEKIKNQLLENELIFNEKTSRLLIKTKNGIKEISGGGSGPTPEEGMTKAEIIEWLGKNGITVTEEGNSPIQIANLSEITLIHEKTGKKFSFTVDPEGNLKSYEIPGTNIFKRLVTATGNTEAQMLIELATYMGKTEPAEMTNTRGFVGNYLGYEERKKATGKTDKSSDIGLYSDRVKIASFYAPTSGRKSYGCSHAYIELENTGDKDFQLEGCYIHFATGKCAETASGTDQVSDYSLALNGIIPAGGTYLIRGKQYVDPGQAECVINVDKYDIEWYTESGNLIDLTLHDNNGFALTYGFPGAEYLDESEKSKALTYATVLEKINSDTAAKTLEKTPWVYHPGFIDAVCIGGFLSHGGTSSTTWSVTYSASGVSYTSVKYTIQTRDCIYKNTFELDPAKQAFQSCNTIDSSRKRNENVQDYQYVFLDSEVISFPKTPDTFPVSKYTPKASFQKKNVCTDKSKLDLDKPNMVTCSFGINIHTTRCFNWVSCGYHDEYIWVKKSSDTAWSKFESYKGITTATANVPFADVVDHGIESDSNPYTILNIKSTYVYPVNYIVDAKGKLKRVTTKDATPSYTEGHYIINSETGLAESAVGHTEGFTYTITYTLTYNTYAGTDKKAEGSTIQKKHFGVFLNKTTSSLETVESTIYDRLTGTFPADGTKFTSHKCVLQIIDSPATTGAGVEYEYKVGRADINGNPDPSHCSDVQTFTLYPTTCKPKIYQTTDQQGFHWIEYQVWAAAADKLNETINESIPSGIIPILVNTGDMTQNGTRINEWFDYYQGGRNLFKHLEQMNVVGNNDLCGPNPEILGTGDDAGKSNSHYFHLFYCYEINPDIFLPIITNDKATHYIPSFYYFDSYTGASTLGHRFIMFNSEVTATTCETWYKQFKSITISGATTTKTVNIYTGWPIYDQALESSQYDDSFTTIYTMLYDIIDDAKNSTTHSTISGKNIVVAMHEMPFTVITHANLKINIENVDRSLKEKASGALVGSHANRLGSTDANGIYWFSRLLEHFGIRLVIGGHKHTYACTNSIREFYYYKDGDVVKNSLTHGKMPMTNTLKYDTATWSIKLRTSTEGGNIYTVDGTYGEEKAFSTTKFPLMVATDNQIGIKKGESVFYPFYGVTSTEFGEGGIIYFMCQATGYKLKSNKELPSPDQKFSYVIPKTTPGDTKDTPDGNQQRPMFSVIEFKDTDSDGIDDQAVIYLYRIENIMNGTKLFSQVDYSTAAATYKYLEGNPSDVAENLKIYGAWRNNKIALITITL